MNRVDKVVQIPSLIKNIYPPPPKKIEGWQTQLSVSPRPKLCKFTYSVSKFNGPYHPTAFTHCLPPSYLTSTALPK